MVSLGDIYNVLAATVPLYVSMLLAYLSVRWWKIFTPEECSGINKFVARFSVPLLSFHVISTCNPYKMDVKLAIADTLQKALAILTFAVVGRYQSNGWLDWLITGFSLSTLPNTLVVGIPLIKAMYGEDSAKLLAQIVVLQIILWYTFLLVLFEIRAAGVATGNSQAAGDVTGNSQPASTEAGNEIQAQNDGDREIVNSSEKRSTMKVLKIVWWKLIMNPNTSASVFGLAWALISFRWGIHLPLIISKSISILADGGLGMAMFSLGLFMASQAQIISCGMKIAAMAIAVRFVLSPAMMAIASYAIGMRRTMLSIAIVQAALPQGIVPFVFAKEYNLHPGILSTGIFVGMIVAVPIALAYYFLLHTILGHDTLAGYHTVHPNV